MSKKVSDRKGVGVVDPKGAKSSDAKPAPILRGTGRRKGSGSGSSPK